MDLQALKEKVRARLKEEKAILLAHNYQRDEIQEIADLGGDSLELSIKASQTDAEVIVFAGVDFMAESAAVLSPGKRVLLPRMDAFCPMAAMIDAEALKKLRAEHPGAPVVTYVNTSAEIKALSDICCTSANSVAVVNSLDGAREVIMTPDKNLAMYTQRFTDKKIILCQGFCCIHEDLTAAMVKECMAEHPGYAVMAHPECRPEVLDLADHICSTSGMYTWARESGRKKFIVCTENGILYRLRRENPDKEFVLAHPLLECQSMKLTTLESILEALDSPEKHTVTVPPEVREGARRALDRMIAVPRN